MKALLIYPEYPETFWNFRFALRFIAKKAAYPPLDLLTVAAMMPDLSSTPGPSWELIRFADYAALSIQLSRGCPYDCEFCNITSLFGRVPRLKSKEQIIAELDRLYRSGWRGDVFFADDNFIGHQAKVKRDILPAIIAWMQRRKYPFVFNSQVPVNLADDPELMELMTRAGFTCVFVGIESPDDACLVECSKTPNRNRDLLASVYKIQQSGLEVQGGFIVGFDHDSHQSLTGHPVYIGERHCHRYGRTAQRSLRHAPVRAVDGRRPIASGHDR